ncbi:hypothetical protein MUO14_05675 [Halobacillus shinanisalinarum]|uniref:Uncharacterized protein n=1 Tax=Halobacillus shinanisalinarum TaxID=2932258 RepID=A0ABY4H2Q8_9BACI|nr:hypothetical protein [Halobacillus shinanisalinarum]UOQ94443.1 hypothetical protein MUO14_05675 [Halobacillus shinanisalinarum]
MKEMIYQAFTDMKDYETVVLQIISDMGVIGKKDDFMVEGLQAIHKYKQLHPEYSTNYQIYLAVQDHFRSLLVSHD